MSAARGPSPGSLCDLGVRARRDGNRRLALVYCELAAATDPRLARARLEAARELAALSRCDDAVRMFQHIIADDPEHVQAMFDLATLLRERSGSTRRSGFFGRPPPYRQTTSGF
jgi:hypothetical protein